MDQALSTRRTFISRTLPSFIGTVTVAGCSGTANSNNNGQTYGGWLSDVDGYSGVVDETHVGEVTIIVGAEGGGAYFAFDPVAVKISPETTVVWKWNGKGGSHNVVDKKDNFQSKLTDEKGFTYSQTFEQGHISKYYCKPHRSSGMKGVVEVI